jgi:uridine phosphorylase
VVNELDALFNMDLELKSKKEQLTQLNLIRLGTSGALQPEIDVNHSFMVSAYAIGLDGLIYFYEQGPFVMEREMTSSFINQMEYDPDLPKPYAVEASNILIEKLSGGWAKGITLTAPGFYAPQGREVRLKVSDNTLVNRASRFRYNGLKVANFEMEASALYALSAMLGHQALTICDVIANRITGKFSRNYKSSMERLIGEVLDRLVAGT